MLLVAEDDFDGSDDHNLDDESNLPSNPVIKGDELQNIEKNHIEKILARENGHTSKAARALNISRRKLYRLIEKYKIVTS